MAKPANHRPLTGHRYRLEAPVKGFVKCILSHGRESRCKPVRLRVRLQLFHLGRERMARLLSLPDDQNVEGGDRGPNGGYIKSPNLHWRGK